MGESHTFDPTVVASLRGHSLIIDEYHTIYEEMHVIWRDCSSGLRCANNNSDGARAETNDVNIVTNAKGSEVYFDR